MCREMWEDTKKLYDDVISMLNVYGVEYTTAKSEFKITVNGNTLYLYGLNSAKKKTKGADLTGLPHFGNVKYIFVFFEERYEFSESQINSVKEAVRSIGIVKPQMIVLNACNPWSSSHPYIKYCSRHQSFNANILREKGQIIGVYDIVVGSGNYTYTKKVLFHYTNWRINAKHLSESEIMNILDTWNHDPRRAAVVDLGMPGIEQGAIYNHLVSGIAQSIYQEHEYFCCGGDYGWGRDETSGKTVFYFGAASMTSGIDLYGEYESDNHVKVKSPLQVVKEVVQFYVEMTTEYVKETYGFVTNRNIPTINVRVDNAANELISMLNQEARNRNLRWLTFQHCKKYPIQDRIEITLALMSRQKLRVNMKHKKFPVKLLQQEMNSSRYEESKSQIQKREKVDDHAINGFEYAIENVMYKFSREVPEMFKKRSKIWI